MSLKKKVLTGVFWTAIEQFANQIIGFVISVILARLLLPEEFGLIAMLAIFMAVGNTLIDSGLTLSLIRTPDPDEKDFSTVFYFNLAGSIVIYGIVASAAPYIADFYGQPQLTSIARVYSLVFIINAFAAVQKTKLTKQLNFKTQMLVATPSLILSGIVGVVLALYGYGVWSLVWSRIAQAVAASIQLWLHSKWRPAFVFDLKKFKQHFGFGYKLMFSGLLNAFFSNIYVIIIGKYFAPAQVGFFDKANGLQMRPVGIISGVLNKISFPVLAEIQNDDIRLKKAYQRIMQMVIFLLAPILIFTAVLAEPVFRFIYTEKWLPAVPYFQILCVTGILYPLNDYNLQILNIKGRSDLFLRLEIIKKILVVAVLFAVFQFGIYGLLFGRVLLSFLSFGINTYYSGRFINYTTLQQIKDIIPTITIALLAGVLIFVVDSYLIALKVHDLFRILLGGIIGVVTFVAFSWWLKIEAMTEIKNIIQRKK